MNNENILKVTDLKSNQIVNKKQTDLIIDESSKENNCKDGKFSFNFWLKKLTGSRLIKSDKPIKKIKLLMLIALACVLLIFIFNSTKITTTDKTNNEITFSNSYVSAIDYTNILENKLCDVLSKIKGAGSVSVMISLKTSPQIVIAETTDQKDNSSTTGTNSSSYTTTVTEPIIISNNGDSYPLVVSEVLPEIKGVIVVASGADDVNVKLNLINAVKSLLNISNNSIQIFAGN